MAEAEPVRAYTFGHRPKVMWTGGEEQAHIRQGGMHEALCGEFVDIFAQGMPKADTLTPSKMTCLTCEKKVLVMADILPEVGEDDNKEK